MSKNFKALIRERYKGRGNCWVKVPKDNIAYSKTLELISKVDASNYINHVEREGFAWIRFSKPAGTDSDPRCLFEVRFKGSKIDHPDCVLDLSDSIAKLLPLLGNTPVKLQLEIEPSKRKVKQANNVAPKKRKSKKNGSFSSSFTDEDHVKTRVESIQEAVLTKPTTGELKEWEAFLKAEGLLEYSV